MKRQEKKSVYVAMSGGVDSSVAAALLKKRGFNVVGVFMKPWSPDLSTKTLLTTPRVVVDKCMWKEDREDAMRVASTLGIPFKTWDFSKQYKKSVTDYMVREYKAGRTPNPDVMCNKEIKFGLFFDKAMKEGADYIATGHYVKVKHARGPAPHHPRDARLLSARHWGPHSGHPSLFRELKIPLSRAGRISLCHLTSSPLPLPLGFLET